MYVRVRVRAIMRVRVRDRDGDRDRVMGGLLDACVAQGSQLQGIAFEVGYLTCRVGGRGRASARIRVRVMGKDRVG